MTVAQESQLEQFMHCNIDRGLEHLSSVSAALVRWYGKHARPLPWRVLWKQHRDPYHVWLSEVMLQQTLMSVVIPRYHDFLEAFPNVQALAAAAEEDLRAAVRGLGYYRRFNMLHQAAKQIVAPRAKGARKANWPDSFTAWKALPGVGDYTAAAVSSITLGEPEAVVDGNVERVFCRLFDIRLPPNLPALKKVFKRLGNLCIDHDRPGDFNQALMELGQLVCTPSQPACDLCPVQGWCRARQHRSVDLAPAAKIKKDYVSLDLNLVIFHEKGQIGLLKRPGTAKFLKNTEGFFTLLRDGNSLAPDGAGHRFRRTPRLKKLGLISHSITNHRLKVHVALGDAQDLPAGQKLKWLTIDQVEPSLIANLDRKAWKVFLKNGGASNLFLGFFRASFDFFLLS